MTESAGSTAVAEGGESDRYTIQLSTIPTGPVEIQAVSGPQTELSIDDSTFGSKATLVLSDASPATVFVRAIDDAVVEGPMMVSITHAIVASGDPAYSDVLSPVGTVAVSITDNDVLIAPIAAIQGPGRMSPLVGAAVTTRGIVTARKSNGFYIQEPDDTTDGDAATSEGVFVFTSSTPTVSPGDYVQVSATVSEFVPAADPLSAARDRARPSSDRGSFVRESAAGADRDHAAMTTAPNAVQLLESLEGMRVLVPSLTVVGPTLPGTSNEAAATSTTSGVFYGVVTGVARPFREPGIDADDPLPAGSPCCIPRFDGNPERLRVDSDAQPGAIPLDLDVGRHCDRHGGSARLHLPHLHHSAGPGIGHGHDTQCRLHPAAAAGLNEIVVAGFNMERFFDAVTIGVDDVALTAAAFERRLARRRSPSRSFPAS